MKVKVINFDNSEVLKEVELNAEIFAQEVRSSILHRVVNWQLAKRRAGTHKTKTIGEISGTTKKPFKQKGTGNARQGSLRSPQFRGGAVIFGPVVRSHAYKLTKKFRLLALKIALSSKLKNEDLLIVNEISPKEVKTSAMSKKIKSYGFESALFIDSDAMNENFRKSTSNLIGFDVLPVKAINVYDILNHKKLILTEAALESLNVRFSNAK